MFYLFSQIILADLLQKSLRDSFINKLKLILTIDLFIAYNKQLFNENKHCGLLRISAYYSKRLASSIF